MSSTVCINLPASEWNAPRIFIGRVQLDNHTAWGQAMNRKSLLLAIAFATAFAGSAYAADVVTTGDVNSVGQWYGRAGGLTGSDRVHGLHAGDGKVGISFDQDVAARTNMARERNTGAVGVTWDRDVAARTNMQRESTPPSSTATVPGPTHN
jgi:opacity protein-like surface antigen